MSHASLITLITRPGAAGQQWVDALHSAGLQAQCWPAFEIHLHASDEAQKAFAQLAAFDCVVLVSPMAVQAVARLRNAQPWPEAVALAAVGEATVRAVHQILQPSARTRIIAPKIQDGAAGSEAGSEVLWPALQAFAPRRVLLARAQQGRDWLAQQLQAQGADVTTVAVYERVPQPLSAAQRAQLQRWRDEGVRIVTVFTSSEAVDVVLESADLLRDGSAVATHSRIAQRLHQRGVTDVRIVPPQAAALIQTLQTLSANAT